MENRQIPADEDAFLVAIRAGMKNRGWNNKTLAREAGKLRCEGEKKGKPYSQQAMTSLLSHGTGGITMKTNVAVAVGFITYGEALERGKEILQNKSQKAETDSGGDKMAADANWVRNLEKRVDMLEAIITRHIELHAKRPSPDFKKTA